MHMNFFSLLMMFLVVTTFLTGCDFIDPQPKVSNESIIQETVDLELTAPKPDPAILNAVAGSPDNVLTESRQTPRDGTTQSPRTVVIKDEVSVIDEDQDGVIDTADGCLETKIGAKVDTNGCYLVLAEKRIFQLDIIFHSGSVTFDPVYEVIVKELAEFLTHYPNTHVVIEGHTDNVGLTATNQKLSEHRAEAVEKVLIEKYQVKPELLSHVGYGDTQPMADNNTEEGRELNRRIVATVQVVEPET